MNGTVRKNFVDHMLAIEDTIRGLLKVHDLKLGAVHRCTFAAKVETFSGGHVIKVKMLIAAIIATGLLFAAQSAQAHCDSLDGPVAKAVRKALETGNVNPVLAYAPATAEAEIRAAFEKSRKVRDLGTDARALADQAFMETVIRLHRAGEGAAYTGLKPAGNGPVIPAAEHAVETGDPAKLKAVLVEEIEHALRERLAHVRELQKAPLEPKTAAEVPHARERVTAELGFVTFAETIHQAALGKGAEHHID